MPDYKNIPLSCLRPRLIVNPSTGERLTVGCGSCKACLQRMSNKASYLASLQEADYQFCMFATLTYSNDNMPLLHVQECNTSCACDIDYDSEYRQFDFYDVTERFCKSEEVFGKYITSASVRPFELKALQRKFKYFGDKIPYLSVYDSQCFLKRFNTNLKREYKRLFHEEFKSEIKYLLVGEYGPVHFRPHFHVLYYFDDKRILEIFAKVLSKSWTSGRVDYSLSRHQCASYVAKYVNCRVSLPRLFGNYALRPFSHHSKGFGQKFYKAQKEKIYETAPKSFDVISRDLFGKNVPTYAWRSLVSLFFPKCRRFNDSNHYERAYTYKLIRTACRFYGFENIKDLSTQILNEFICRDVDPRKIVTFDKPKDNLNYFLCFVANLIAPYERGVLRPDFSFRNITFMESKRMLCSLINLFYVSWHFYEFVCDSDMSKFDLRLSQIEEYYKYVDYKNLCNQYQQQEDLITDVDSSSYLIAWYDNVFPCVDDDGVRYFVLSDYEVHLYKAVSSSPFYQAFQASVNDNWSKNVKHKQLNDMNDIFLNENSISAWSSM